MPRFLLRDGNAVMAEINPDWFDVFAYTDHAGARIKYLLILTSKGVDQEQLKKSNGNDLLWIS